MADFRKEAQVIEISVYAEVEGHARFLLCSVESAFVPRVGDGFDYTDHHFYGPCNRLSVALRVIWVRWDYQEDIQQFFSVHIGAEPLNNEERALLLLVRARQQEQQDGIEPY